MAEPKANTLIEIPEPMSEHWAQVLRRWGKKYELGTMLARLPREIRSDLYRLVFSCYPIEIYLRDNPESIRLIIENGRTAGDLDFTKAGLRKSSTILRYLVDDLMDGISVQKIVQVDTIEIESYMDAEHMLVVAFAVNLGGERYHTTYCDLCIELLEAFREMLRMVD